MHSQRVAAQEAPGQRAIWIHGPWTEETADAWPGECGGCARVAAHAARAHNRSEEMCASAHMESLCTMVIHHVKTAHRHI